MLLTTFTIMICSMLLFSTSAVDDHDSHDGDSHDGHDHGDDEAEVAAFARSAGEKQFVGATHLAIGFTLLLNLFV